jgi:hypothetical protein
MGGHSRAFSYKEVLETRQTDLTVMIHDFVDHLEYRIYSPGLRLEFDQFILVSSSNWGRLHWKEISAYGIPRSLAARFRDDDISVDLGSTWFYFPIDLIFESAKIVLPAGSFQGLSNVFWEI